MYGWFFDRKCRKMWTNCCSAVTCSNQSFCCSSQKWRKWHIKQIDEDIKYFHPLHYGQIVVMRNLLKSSIVCRSSQKWRKWRIKQIDEDIKYCHPRWPEEKLFLENEKMQLDQFKSNYFQDFWFVSTLLRSVNASMYFKTR